MTGTDVGGEELLAFLEPLFCLDPFEELVFPLLLLRVEATEELEDTPVAAAGLADVAWTCLDCEHPISSLDLFG